MKKLLTIFFVIAMAFGCVMGIAGCGDNGGGNGGDNGGITEGGGDATTVITDKASIGYAFDGVYTKGELKDEATGFASAEDIISAKILENGAYLSSFTEFKTRKDTKMELYGENATRIVNASGGIVYTLPTTQFEADYSIAKYRVQYTFGDSVLTASSEASNPYTGESNPWYTYCSEWLIKYVNDGEFYTKNGLELINGTHVYEFTERHSYGDLEVKDGYDVYRYDIKIKDAGETERPYYNIAIVREKDKPVRFALFVLKSATDGKEIMDTIVASYRSISPKGKQDNYFDAGEAIANPDWSEETKAYYDSFMAAKAVNWGAFSLSIPEAEDALDPESDKYKTNYANIKAYQELVEDIWDYKYDIFPTYGHLSFGGIDWSFPLSMATELAGGNGVNGKPVLQYSYQYTTNNNIVASKITPLFDIMRGTYDDKFHKMANDIKTYGKPVLFRLNNEMNTDWTSYCGMLTLLDPDVFNITWRRLYDIFEEEGVDNVIWIWNPQDVSCPYSSWGEDLCYFPGLNYAQLLGITRYEENNGKTQEEAEGIEDTFETYYSALYEKNKTVFSKWGMTISEFACGSGGNKSGGERGRNRESQANWILNMMTILTQPVEERPEWAQAIKLAVWFNCENISNGVVENHYRFCDPFTAWYDDLKDTTWVAFKDAFAMQKELKQSLGLA